MFIIDDVIISEGLKTLRFGCCLSSCLGGCCVDGDGGAPLLKDEADWILANQDKFLGLLKPESRKRIAITGLVAGEEDDLYAPLHPDAGACVYLVDSLDGVQICIFEKLYLDKKSDFYKPLSCHLFPLILKKASDVSLLSFEKREICAHSWNHGDLLVEFCQNALKRAFGEEFYFRLIAEIRKES